MYCMSACLAFVCAVNPQTLAWLAYYPAIVNFNCCYLHQFLWKLDIIIVSQTAIPFLFLSLQKKNNKTKNASLQTENGGNSRRLKKQRTRCYQSWKAWSYCNAPFEVKHGCVSCDKCTSKQSGCVAARAVSPVMAFGLCSVPADIIYLWQLCLWSPHPDY